MSTSRYRRSNRRPSMRRRGKVEDVRSVVIDAVPDERGISQVRRRGDGGGTAGRRRLPLRQHGDGVRLSIREVDEPGIVRDRGDVPRLVRDAGAAREPRRNAAPELLAMEDVQHPSRELRAERSLLSDEPQESDEPARRDSVVDPVVECGLVLYPASK